jgi:hypothetical protein
MAFSMGPFPKILLSSELRPGHLLVSHRHLQADTYIQEDRASDLQAQRTGGIKVASRQREYFFYPPE